MWGRLAQPCYKYQVLNVPLKGWDEVVSPSCVTGESAPRLHSDYSLKEEPSAPQRSPVRPARVVQFVVT